MKPLSSIFNKPEPVLHFAGFTFPRSFQKLCGSGNERRRRYITPISSPYYIIPPVNTPGAFCYLESDFMPGLRWSYCDDVPDNWGDAPRIRHTGWFCDDFGDEIFRGIVFKLPASRGFLAGWTMGEGMATEINTSLYENSFDAALAADDFAKVAAEHERECREDSQE